MKVSFRTTPAPPLNPCLPGCPVKVFRRTGYLLALHVGNTCDFAVSKLTENVTVTTCDQPSISLKRKNLQLLVLLRLLLSMLPPALFLSLLITTVRTRSIIKGEKLAPYFITRECVCPGTGVIIQCDELEDSVDNVTSYLSTILCPASIFKLADDFQPHDIKFFERVWENARRVVKLNVLKAGDGDRLKKLDMTIGDSAPDKIYKWGIPEYWIDG